MQYFLGYGFDCTCCAYGHKDRGVNLAPTGGDDPCSGLGIRVYVLYFKIHVAMIH